MIVDIEHCARCGEDHEGLEFQPLTNPIEDQDGTVWAWWALCPKIDEPILMRQLSESENIETE